ncbi:MAG: hypothetical protein H6940_06425 [Burkholderiales bacterium]|nr:hypothetical protein [Burkholderiales bacterium]
MKFFTWGNYSYEKLKNHYLRTAAPTILPNFSTNRSYISTQNTLTFNKNLLGDDIRKLSERLEKFMAVEHHFVDGSLVISLNANFGAGKTTF